MVDNFEELHRNRTTIVIESDEWFRERDAEGAAAREARENADQYLKPIGDSFPCEEEGAAR